MQATIPGSWLPQMQRRSSFMPPENPWAFCQECTIQASNMTSPLGPPFALFYTDGLTVVFKEDEEYGPEKAFE